MPRWLKRGMDASAIKAADQKVRETVKTSLPELLSGPDLLTHPRDRTVKVPIRMLEHARFRLRDADTKSGAGQGAGEDGQILRPADQAGGEPSKGGGARSACSAPA